MGRERRPHALAWWLWAGGMSAAALRTSNPLVLCLLGAVIVVVALVGRGDDPSPSPLATFARVAVVVLVLRLGLEIVFGERLPGHVLVSLPSVPLPSWAEGVSIGGPVTVEAVLAALAAGLRLGVVLLAFGAANALADPRELLRSLPGVLHEVAVAITVAICFAPEVLASVRRVRQARLLRGRPTTGVAGLRGIAVPVLEDALERSVQLAASMGARGFGRTTSTPSRARERSALLLVVAGSLAVLGGGYGLLTGGGIVPMAPAILIGGVVLLAGGVGLSGRRSVRTRYRPAPFGPRSLLVASAGWLCALGLAVAGILDPGSVTWSPWPLAWPLVTPLALAAVIAGLAPLLVVHVAPRPSTHHRAKVLA